MKLTEFMLWWINQDQNGIVVLPYLMFCGMITVLAFFNLGVLVGVFCVILFASLPLYLLGYIIVKYFEKTYAEWAATQDKQKR